MIALALPRTQGYGSLQVVVNPAAQGVRTLRENLAHMRPHPIAGAFFVPAMSLYGGPCWAGFGLAGFQVSRFLTPARSATLTREKVGGSSSIKLGAPSMKHALNPSRAQAAFHRACALAALRADSSLATRLSRYNAHMRRARAVETMNVGGVK